MPSPKVSVLILSWNNAPALAETLQRLRAESKKIDLEIIVWDQASDDGTRDLLASSDVIAHVSPENVGNSLSRNSMMRQARGEYFLFLDADIVPVRGSVRRMSEFLDTHLEFGAIAYQPQFDDKFGQTEPSEQPPIDDFSIAVTQVDDWSARSGVLMYSQYGMYRRHFFEHLTFPEFAPFDSPGWGCEDNILGVALSDFGCRVAIIRNPNYLHMRHASWRHFEYDEVQAFYGKRCAAMMAFTYALDPDERAHALRPGHGGEPFEIEVPARPYYYTGIQNLGDMAFPQIVADMFPMIRFVDREATDNVIALGGSVLGHWAHAARGARRFAMIGCGIAHDHELHAAVPRGTHVIVYPRGPITLEFVRRYGIDVFDAFVGDTAGLLAWRYPPAKYTPGALPLYVQDAFSEEAWRRIRMPAGARYIACAYAPGLPMEVEKCVTIPHFERVIADWGGVVSSQIHPALIAWALGVPAQIVPKDLRAHDLVEAYGERDMIMPLNPRFGRLRYSMRRLSFEWMRMFARECGIARFGVEP